MPARLHQPKSRKQPTASTSKIKLKSNLSASCPSRRRRSPPSLIEQAAQLRSSAHGQGPAHGPITVPSPVPLSTVGACCVTHFLDAPHVPVQDTGAPPALLLSAEDQANADCPLGV